MRVSNAQRYLELTLAAIERDLGAALPLGTSAVPAEDRRGSGIATCYPFSDRSAVWCDPDVVARLAPVLGPSALGADEFVAACTTVGAERRGIGLNRVLDGEVRDPDVDLGSVVLRRLDRDDDADVALISGLLDESSTDDIDEADLDIDELDPHIVGAMDETSDGERLLALASARHADWIPFNDIGVLTHPDARRRGLGRASVHRLVVLPEMGAAPAMYRCEVDNVGSGRIATGLGFTLVQTVGSVSFGV